MMHRSFVLRTASPPLARTPMPQNRPRTLVGLMALALAAACSDSPVASNPRPDAGLAQLSCTGVVRTGEITCAAPAPAAGSIRATRIYGGQDMYVRLSSSGTRYDAGSEILESTITVQNLLKGAIGTTDGVTPTGVRVFFDTPPVVTSGTGTIAMVNEDGTGTFTQNNQDFYLYNEILTPYQISQGKVWQFSMPSTVVTFAFTLRVAADQSDETQSLLDAVWTGLTSTAWTLVTNWTGGAPNAGSVAAIPPAAQLLPGASMPVLDGDTVVGALRVGAGSTLDLNAYTLRVGASADAVGVISNGTVHLTGTNSFLSGNFGSLRITGTTATQGAVKATGALNVQGSLNVKGHALAVQIP